MLLVEGWVQTRRNALHNGHKFVKGTLLSTILSNPTVPRRATFSYSGMLIFPWIQVQVLGLPLRLLLRIFNIPVSRSFYLDSCHMPWWRCSLLPIVYNTWPICLELLICLKGHLDSVTIVFASILNALDVWIKSVSATVDNNIVGWTAYDNDTSFVPCNRSRISVMFHFIW